MMLKIQLGITEINTFLNKFKHKTAILNCNNSTVLQYNNNIDQINPALVSRRDFQKYKKI